MERYFTVRVELVEHLNINDYGSDEAVVLSHNINFSRNPGQAIEINFLDAECEIDNYFVQEDRRVQRLARREELLREIESLNRELDSL